MQILTRYVFLPIVFNSYDKQQFKLADTNTCVDCSSHFENAIKKLMSRSCFLGGNEYTEYEMIDFEII